MRHGVIFLLLGALGAIAAPVNAAAGSFTFEAADQAAVSGLNLVNAFATTIRNTGTATDTYTVTTVKSLPADWTASLCQGTVCYPPFIQQISFNLAPGAATNVDVDVTPLISEGSGSVLLTVASQNVPAQTQARTFRVVTTGVQVLLVDGDGGQTLESFYTPALVSSALSWAPWPRHEAGALSSAELAGFTAIIWFADAMAPALDDGDRSALAYYIQHGGNLLLGGQDVAQQACDPASPWYSPQAAGWFPAVLGVSYAGQAAGATEVAGLPSAPFGAALDATLNGAGGAGNSTSPDALTSAGAGIVAQTYRTGAWAAVSSTWGAGRTFFCGYAVESLEPANAHFLLQQFLNWALGLPSSVESLPTAAVPGLPRVAPNPFNPSTTISFDLPAAGSVRVDVCDLRGRVVRRLLRSERPIGPSTTVWDGRDDNGAAAPSGVYLARVSSGGSTQSVKMVLAK